MLTYQGGLDCCQRAFWFQGPAAVSRRTSHYARVMGPKVLYKLVRDCINLLDWSAKPKELSYHKDLPERIVLNLVLTELMGEINFALWAAERVLVTAYFGLPCIALVTCVSNFAE